jgi:hypothetical protein
MAVVFNPPSPKSQVYEMLLPPATTVLFVKLNKLLDKHCVVALETSNAITGVGLTVTGMLTAFTSAPHLFIISTQ